MKLEFKKLSHLKWEASRNWGWLTEDENNVGNIGRYVKVKVLCFYALYSTVYMSKNDKEKKKFSKLHCQGCWKSAKHKEVATVPPS